MVPIKKGSFFDCLHVSTIMFLLDFSYRYNKSHIFKSRKKQAIYSKASTGYMALDQAFSCFALITISIGSELGKH